MITATLNNYRHSPRKVRVVADTIRGKNVAEAASILAFIPKRAGLPIKKLLDSAVANAVQNFQLDKTSLFVKSVAVNQGVTLKRSMPAARGSAHPIKKRTSKITIEVAAKKAK